MSVDVPIQKYPLGDITQRLHENKMRWHVSYIGVGYGKPKRGAPYHPVFVIGLGNATRETTRLQGRCHRSVLLRNEVAK